MSVYAVALKDMPRIVYIVSGETTTDAILTAFQHHAPDDYENATEEAGSYNQLAEDLLANLFNCTEIYRALALEYVERRLDGDTNISIIL